MPPSVARYGVGFAEVSEQLLVVELAVELVNLGYFGLQLLLIALRKAAHDEQLAQPALLFGLGKLKNGVDALLLCRLYEAARVDYGYLARRFPGVMRTLVAVGLKHGHEGLAVHEVL